MLYEVITIPKTKIKPDYIYNCLESETDFNIKSTAKIIWLGNKPIISSYIKTKKGQTTELLNMTFHSKTETFKISLEKEHGLWLKNTLELITPSNKPTSFGDLKKNFETQFENFELFWFSKPLQKLRESA